MKSKTNSRHRMENQGDTAKRFDEIAVSEGILSASKRDTLATFGVELHTVGMEFNRELTQDQFGTIGTILRNLKDRTKTARRLLRGVEQIRATGATGRLATPSLALDLFGQSLRFIPITGGFPYEPSNIDTGPNLLNILHVGGGETVCLERAVEELQALVNEPDMPEELLSRFF